MQKKSFKSGFVAIIGRPNAGKSTLLNAMLGEKIAIVTAKPQTTRNTIRGVKNSPHCQIIFVDTPGIHRGGGLLNRFMVKEALSSFEGVDALLYMVEPRLPVPEGDRFIIEGLKKVNAPVILCINKIDMMCRTELLPIIEQYSGLFSFRDVVPISALKGTGVPVLLGLIEGLLPEGPKYFPDDMVTDQPERFMASEIIREKVFLLTKQEVPYSVAVIVESFREKKSLVAISAVINVERDSQKGIIIGRGGRMLKRIGASAREDIERLLGAKVFLDLFVRVKKDWTKSPGALKEFGY